ncbi:MAG: hypothetical protein HY707_06180 [Ignavibacteriae bacterium]|nr:hypothetical protein [Ignavibacteriota bacterium]
MEQFLGLPPDGSAYGYEIDNLIVIIHWLMFALFVGWGTFYIYTLIRFRKSRQPKATYAGVKSHFSNYVEVGVLIAEIVLLFAFSIPLWSKRVEAFPTEHESTIVRVVAEQFAWNIHYPGPDGIFGKTSLNLVDPDNPLGLDRSDPDAKDDIFTINQLNLPVNKSVIIHLTSKDVIHGFNVPTYRVKQDAIPGTSIPLWFTPVKTTDQIREELRQPFSIAQAMRQVQMIRLPEVEHITVGKGEELKEYVLMQDCSDNSGNTVLSKGERLSKENVAILNEAGVTEVSVRPHETFDRYIAMEEYKDTAGNILVARNEVLLDEQVTKLVEAGMKEVSVRPISSVDSYVAMETYNDHSGSPIVSKGEFMSEEIITRLSEANIGEVIIAPSTPTEIACAQLCGLGHFRMRGYVTVQTQEDFQKWMDEQVASVMEQTQSEQPTKANTQQATPEQAIQEQNN